MSISAETSRVSYSGNGVTTAFAFAHPFLFDSDLVVISVDTTTFVETVKTLTTHYTVTGAGVDSGGTVTMLVAPATGTKLIIYRDPPITQTLELTENDILPVDEIEKSLDKATQLAQTLDSKVSRSFRLTDGFPDTFDTAVPITDDDATRAGYLLGINSAGDGLEFLSPSAALPAGSGLPTPTDANTLLESDGTEFLETAAIEYSGISTLTGAAFTSSGIKDTLDKIIRITYTAPTVSLVGTGSSTLRERGDTVTNPTLTATVTKYSDPIASLAFYDGTVSVPNLIGSTHVGDPPVPNGGVDTQATAVSFSTNRTFRARVIDDGTSGGPTNVDTSVTYSFVYPYYYGAGAVGITAAAVGGLTKQIINEATNTSRTFSVTAGQVVYFAYPASYGVLTSILDVNSFETITDWTLRVENITGLDASAVSYNIYEFDNPIGVSGSYVYTFIQ